MLKVFAGHVLMICGISLGALGVAIGVCGIVGTVWELLMAFFAQYPITWVPIAVALSVTGHFAMKLGMQWVL